MSRKTSKLAQSISKNKNKDPSKSDGNGLQSHIIRFFCVHWIGHAYSTILQHTKGNPMCYLFIFAGLKKEVFGKDSWNSPHVTQHVINIVYVPPI